MQCNSKIESPEVFLNFIPTAENFKANFYVFISTKYYSIILKY